VAAFILAALEFEAQDDIAMAERLAAFEGRAK
jgi:hypothetical protein